MTFGASTEEGIHFAQERTLFRHFDGTKPEHVGSHDSRGDRQITSEGYVFMPSLSPMERNCITWSAHTA